MLITQTRTNQIRIHQNSNSAPTPKLTTTVPITHHASRSGIDRPAALPMAMPAIAVPVADFPLLLLIAIPLLLFVAIPLLPLIAISDSIDITEPSAIVIKASFVAELDILVDD
jgi:hypothetical protein